MQRLVFAFFLLAAWTASPSFAEPARTEHVTAELTAERASLQAGADGPDANWIGVRLEMAPEWHTYWRYPGDTGLATKVQWKLPEGWKVSEPLWQLPQRILLPPLVNFGYQDEALIGFQVKVPAGEASGRKTLSASVSWLVCKEECIPEKAELHLKISVAKGKGRANPWARLFSRLREQAPQAGVLRPLLVDQGGELGLRIPPGVLSGDSFDFFPLEGALVKGDHAPRAERGPEGLTLWMEKASPFNAQARALPGVLVAKQGGRELAFAVEPPLAAAAAVAGGESRQRPEGEPMGVLAVVAFAFLGGLVLNLMPCVFPVLGIKVMSLVKQSGTHKRHARRHGQAYGAGVLVSFWILAAALLVLRAAGEAAGWGFQLQHPGFVAALVFLFSFVAADLAGFVSWGGSWMGAGANLANKEGFAGSFFTGMLAVLVATPCTAPFMGTAIGAAFSQPAWVVMLVFSTLGMGLALPFLALCYFPGFLAALPRPGAWMERLKQVFAFPMAATVLWLLWVLTQQVGADATLKVELALLLAAGAVWLRQQFPGGQAWILGWLLLALAAVVTASATRAGSATAGSRQQAAEGWQPYSEEALENALRAGKPVFVDFTAAWCLTCQVNRKLVLEREGMRGFLREKGVVMLLADWTNHDPAITRALEKMGRIGVPLYLAYPAGKREAVILPQVLTDGVLREAFR